MKWTFSIRQKSKAAIILGSVFLLVFIKNVVDERNVTALGKSFSSVYEDRLLAESYIYKLSDHLYQKKIMLDNCSSQENNHHLKARISQHNTAINSLVTDFEKTHLTQTENTCFLAFKQNVAAISRLENSFLQAGEPEGGETKLKMDKRYEVAAENLQQLSEIQVEEGKMLNEKSKAIIAGSSLLTQFELVVLIGIGLLIQGLIFAARSAVPKKQQPFNLN